MGVYACARLCVNVRVRVSGAVLSERLFVEGTLWSRTRSRCSLEISGVQRIVPRPFWGPLGQTWRYSISSSGVAYACVYICMW